MRQAALMDPSVLCCSWPLMERAAEREEEGKSLYLTQTRRRPVSLSQDRP